MTAEEYKTFSDVFDGDITEVVKAKACADARISFGGASAESVKRNLKSIKKRLKQYTD